jgi:hypothetical protein
MSSDSTRHVVRQHPPCRPRASGVSSENARRVDREAVRIVRERLASVTDRTHKGSVVTA